MKHEVEWCINKQAVEHENNGILAKHFEGFSNCAKSEGVIIVLRHVNSITKELMAKGNYPHKNFHIKDKSSDFAIIAGFIIANNKLKFLSKTGLKDGETIATINEKFRLEHEAKLEKIDAKTFLLDNDKQMILEITKEHFQFFLESEKNKEKYQIKEIRALKNGDFFVASQLPKTSDSVFFYLEKNENGKFKVYYAICDDKANVVDSSEGLLLIPLVVHCAEVNGEKRPIICDYDALAVFWNISNHQNIVNSLPPIPTNSFGNRAKSVESIYLNSEKSQSKQFKDQTQTQKPKQKRNSIAIGEFYYKKNQFTEDKNYGNVSTKFIKLLDKLNQDLGYPEGLKDPLAPVLHNFELCNPFAETIEESSYTIFLPNNQLMNDFEVEQFNQNQEKIDWLAIHCEKNPKQGNESLMELFMWFKQKDFYVPNHFNVDCTKELGWATAGWNLFSNEQIQEPDYRQQEIKDELALVSRQNKVKSQIQETEPLTESPFEYEFQQ